MAAVSSSALPQLLVTLRKETRTLPDWMRKRVFFPSGESFLSEKLFYFGKN